MKKLLFGMLVLFSSLSYSSERIDLLPNESVLIGGTRIACTGPVQSPSQRVVIKLMGRWSGLHYVNELWSLTDGFKIIGKGSYDEAKQTITLTRLPKIGEEIILHSKYNAANTQATEIRKALESANDNDYGVTFRFSSRQSDNGYYQAFVVYVTRV
jgi:hypothetical protein